MKRWLAFGSVALSASAAIAAQYSGYFAAFALGKATTTILIAVWAALGWRKWRRAYGGWVLIALLFCLLGDVLLLEESRFVGGLAAFLVAHLLFCVAFGRVAGFRKDWRPLLWLLAIALPYYGWLWPHLGALALPVGVYMGVIVLMAWQAWALQLNAWPASRIGVAASLFVFSDAVIALHKF
ncbi:MAG: lysoplasmalogenase, partial [Bacteroidota bacterium]